MRILFGTEEQQFSICPFPESLSSKFKLIHSRYGKQFPLRKSVKLFSPSLPFVAMTNTIRCLLLIMSTSLVHAQTAPSALPLWPDAAPGARGTNDQDVPTITPYLADPATASGAAIVIFPGGGYGGLAAHEGKGYADWLVTNGVSCFVVKYRLGSHGYRHPSMLQDAARAVRLVRARAAEWKIDPKRVGIIGSSAGGHLVATLATHFDSGKPDATDVVERQSCGHGVAVG